MLLLLLLLLLLSLLLLASSLKCGLGRVVVCGRTDRDVSAISQIVNFSPFNITITPEEVVNAVRHSSAYEEGRLVVYECARVPKKFNSRSSAIWRKYTYLFPVNRIFTGKSDIDVDVDRLNTLLQKYVYVLLLS